MPDLVIATRNRKKLEELRRYLRGLNVTLSCLEDIAGAPRIREDGVTFRQNAEKKARTISAFTGGLVLADDSGLVVDALGGMPGIRSSRFSGPGATDPRNNRKLLAELEGVPMKRRAARFVCHVAIADGGRIVTNIEADCRGRIAFEIRGSHGFGYDPLFLIPKFGKTFGELGAPYKDKMSHRSKALRKAVSFLKRYL